MQEFNIDAHMACRFRRPDLRKRHLSPQLIALHELMLLVLTFGPDRGKWTCPESFNSATAKQKKKCFSMRKRSIKKTHYVPLA